MEFIDIVKSRYATKKFNGELLPQEKVDELLEMIRLSPSSFNIQPWKIMIITDQEIKEKLKPVSWNQEQITTCSHLLVFCAQTDLKLQIKKLNEVMVKNGRHPDEADAYSKRMSDFTTNKTKEELTTYAQKQIYIALSNALNGAKALGFDSCPMEGFDKNSYSKILDLPDTIVPTVLCPIGYAADTAKEKIRFSKEDVFF